MYSYKSRISLILICLLIGGVAFLDGRVHLGGFALTVVALLIWGHFRYSTVWIAFRKIQSDRYEEAEKLIDQIRNPNRLDSSHKAYYFWTLAFIELHKHNYQSAEGHLLEALNYDLKTDNDQAIINLSLAEIQIGFEKYMEAEKYITKAKELNTRPMVVDLIEEVIKQIKAAQSAETCTAK